MADYNKELIKILRNNGCTFVRHGKGNHDIWHSPISNKNVTVDHKIKSRDMAIEVLKQSGLPKYF